MDLKSIVSRQVPKGGWNELPIGGPGAVCLNEVCRTTAPGKKINARQTAVSAFPDSSTVSTTCTTSTYEYIAGRTNHVRVL